MCWRFAAREIGTLPIPRSPMLPLRGLSAGPTFRIFRAGLEGDAQKQDDLANQLEHTGKGKNDAITKIFNAMGSVPAVKYHVEAAKYRAEAARLQEELAKIENQDKFSAVIPAP